MTFSEFAQGLSPYCSFGKPEPDFFVEIIGNFVQDAAMDACKLLTRKPDTKYRYVKGDRSIQPKDAQYLYDHRDIDKFADWIWERMDESDSYDKVEEWLVENGLNADDPSRACAELLESIILDLNRRSATSLQAEQAMAIDVKLIDEIQEKIKSLPRPADVPVPAVATDDEQVYIEELFRAYGEAESKPAFSSADLSSYPEYAEDFEDRRIDFYAAETIRRGVLELGGGSLSDQFDVLKDETFDSIKDTARKTYSNGYERMLTVMEQAVNSPVTNYLLSASPYWISGKIKKGVCHHLVNAKKLMWVRRKKKP